MEKTVEKLADSQSDIEEPYNLSLEKKEEVVGKIDEVTLSPDKDIEESSDLSLEKNEEVAAKSDQVTLSPDNSIGLETMDNLKIEVRVFCLICNVDENLHSISPRLGIAVKSLLSEGRIDLCLSLRHSKDTLNINTYCYFVWCWTQGVKVGVTCKDTEGRKTKANKKLISNLLQ